MKRPLILLVAALSMGAALTAAAQKAAADPQALIQEGERLVEALRADFAKASAEVDAAITKAATAGTLKSSTEAYFRDVLGRFKPQANGLPAVTGAYYPPKFDTSPEMEPINLAWDSLRQVVERIQNDLGRQRQRLLLAVAEAVETAARVAEKPEDLATAEALVAAARKIPETSQSSARSPLDLGTPDSLVRILGAMRSALNASQQRDAGALATALQRISTSTGGSFGFRMQELPFRVEVLWTEFRERMAAVHRRAAQESQRAIEKAILSKQPDAECERLLGEFEARLQQVDRLTVDNNDPMRRTMTYPSQSSTSNDPRFAVPRAYRTVLQLRSLDLASDDGSGRNPQVPTPVVDGPYAMSAEFRTHLAGLTTEIATRKKAITETAEKKRREESAATEKKRMDEERERRAKEVAEQNERSEKARDTIRARLKAVRTAREALSLADEIPALLTVSESRSGDGSLNWNQLSQELRQLAAWWIDPSGASETQSAGFDRSQTAQFTVELKALRDRAMRDVMAARFEAPQINQPPLSELPARMAVQRVAEAAGASGDWLRAYEILHALSATGRARGETSALSDRMNASRAYLAGLNSERAAQFQDAITSYRQVLQQVGEHLPIKEAGERLKALRTEHPEAFADPLKASSPGRASGEGGR